MNARSRTSVQRDSDGRQYGRILAALDAHERKQASLGDLVVGLESPIRSLEDVAQRAQLLMHWAVLEDVYIVSLDDDTQGTLDHNLVAEAIRELRSVLAAWAH